MIRPEQANVLKPEEITWLRESEEKIDRLLLAGFAGSQIEISIQRAPYNRTTQILMGEYLRNGWVSSQTTATSALVTYRFSANAQVPQPAFPVQGEVVETSEDVEVLLTAWERINQAD